METTDAFEGQVCRTCNGRTPVEWIGRCPDCEGPLTARVAPAHLGADELGTGNGGALGRFDRLLPFPDERLVSLEAGETPLLEVPTIAKNLGVGSLAVKDEGRNPTGSFADRWAALSVTAARETGASLVALPSAGNGAQAVAAAATRTGLDAHAYVPSRSAHVNKAMINVHGADMTVVPGRFDDTRVAYDEDAADAEWFPAGPFATAFPLEGAKTVAFELAHQRAWAVPDAIVAPVGHGSTIAGLAKGFRELRGHGIVESEPRLYAAQSAGCAPIVASWEGAGDVVTTTDQPDTVCGELEIPDPAGGELVLAALENTDGGAVACPDEAILEAATTLAGAGLSASVSGGAALAGARQLADAGVLELTDDVVLLDPLAGTKEADILRSHLMSKGI